jgi:hypothetical protein
LNFRLSFYDFPWDVGAASDVASDTNAISELF